MAFDRTGFFTVLGKTIKLVDIIDGYIDAIETGKTAIYTVQAAESLQDLYAPYPALAAGFQDQFTSMINTLIDQSRTLFLDREYVIEQLVVSNQTVEGVLDAIYDNMLGDATIKCCIVSIGEVGSTADVDETNSSENQPFSAQDAVLFCSRKLDGVNDPGNGVAANARFFNQESQLARTTIVHAEVTDNSVVGSETVLLFSLAEETGPYVLQDEEPGVGPTLANAEASNLIGTNWNFTVWGDPTADDPTGWAMSGGTAGTAYEDASGAGVGPLRVNTDGVKAVRKINGLQHLTSYFLGAFFQGVGSTDSSDIGFSIKLRNAANTTTYMTARTNHMTDDVIEYTTVNGFFMLANSVNLDDVYLEVEYEEETPHADKYGVLRKIVLAPATYYNGLAWAWWAPAAATNTGSVALGSTTRVEVSNNDGGVIQRFIRKAFNYQLPSTDSPSIADSLAT